MANSSSSSSKRSAVLPVRSISLPSRLPSSSHPKLVAELSKFQTLVDCTSATRAETLRSNMTKLAELYIGIEELISSPTTQKAMLKDQKNKIFVDILEELITLLDACGSARELILRLNKEVQDLQSALRRKGGVGSSIRSQVQCFICFRKTAKRDVAKCLTRLVKSMGCKNSGNNSCNYFLNLDDHLVVLVEVLRGLSSTAVSVLKSLLIFCSPPKSSGNTTGWPLVSRLMLTSSERGMKKSVFNEVESVDCAVFSIQGQITKKNSLGASVLSAVREKLETLECCLEGFEDGVDRLHKCLIRNRVCLLNVLTP